MRAIDADALIADCQLAQKQADRHGREFANAFYSGGGEVSTEWWCVEDMIENAPTIEPRCEACEAFNKTRLLIPQPEPELYGYRLDYLIAFATACRRAGVEEEDLKTFTNNLDFAFQIASEELRRQQMEAVAKSMGGE